jgi:hypothetical protein
LNKLATSQEINDLLVLQEFPLFLWVIFVLLDPDPDPYESGFETVNSTSVLLNKLATSQEFDDLLILEEFSLFLVENIVEDGGVHEERPNPHHLVRSRGRRRRVQAENQKAPMVT